MANRILCCCFLFTNYNSTLALKFDKKCIKYLPKYLLLTTEMSANAAGTAVHSGRPQGDLTRVPLLAVAPRPSGLWTAAAFPKGRSSTRNCGLWLWPWTNQWASNYVFHGLQTQNKRVSCYKIHVLSNISLKNTSSRNDVVSDSFLEGSLFQSFVSGHVIHSLLSLQCVRIEMAKFGHKVRMLLLQMKFNCTLLYFYMIKYLPF